MFNILYILTLSYNTIERLSKFIPTVIYTWNLEADIHLWKYIGWYAIKG